MLYLAIILYIILCLSQLLRVVCVHYSYNMQISHYLLVCNLKQNRLTDESWPWQFRIQWFSPTPAKQPVKYVTTMHILLECMMTHLLEFYQKVIFFCSDIRKRCIKFNYIFAGSGTYQNARLSVQKKTLSTGFSQELFTRSSKTDGIWSPVEVDVESFQDFQVYRCLCLYVVRLAKKRLAFPGEALGKLAKKNCLSSCRQ